MKHLLRVALAALFFTAAPSWAEEIGDLNVSDASNTTRWPEGMAAGNVNDSARSLEGILARWYADENCSTATAGSSNAYTFAANQTLSAYYDGLLICFDASFSNTGAATLNVDSLGAKTIKKLNDQDLASGDIESGGKYLVAYDGTNFQLLTPISQGNTAVTDADNQFSAKQSIVSTDPDASEDLGLDLYRNSASPAANDELEPLRFKGEDSAGNETTYCKILPVLADPTDTSEDGYMRLDCQRAGTLTSGFAVGTSIYANGNSDPGAGDIDADAYYQDGTQIHGLHDLTTLTLTSSAETTAIPAGTVAIDLVLNGVSADAADNSLFVEMSDSGTYPSSSSSVTSAEANTLSTRMDSESGGPLILVGDGNGSDSADWDAADAVSGNIYLRKDDENRWSMTSTLHDTGNEILHSASGIVTLSGVADRLKLSLGSGSFDAGELTVKVYQ